MSAELKQARLTETQRRNEMSNFKEFLGKSALNGKKIAVYEDDEKIIVKAETVGGKNVRYIYINEKGEKAWATVKPLHLTREQYDSFKELVTDGCNSPQDVVVVQRALEEMGFPAFEE